MKPKRAQPAKRTWQLSRSDKARFWFGLAWMFFMLAAFEYYSPAGPDSGAWAWVKAQAIQAFGVNGVVLLFAVAGLATLILAIASFSKKEAS